MPDSLNPAGRGEVEVAEAPVCAFFIVQDASAPDVAVSAAAQEKGQVVRAMRIADLHHPAQQSVSRCFRRELLLSGHLKRRAAI